MTYFKVKVLRQRNNRAPRAEDIRGWRCNATYS